MALSYAYNEDVPGETVTVTRMHRFERRVVSHDIVLPKNRTPQDLIGGIAAWEEGAFIQDALPWLPAADREFIMTGITPEEWDAAFPPEEE